MRRSAISFRHMPLSARIGVGIVALNLVLAVLAPWISPYGETDVITDAWVPGFWNFDPDAGRPFLLLGSDQLGRDLLTRLFYGARNTISIATVTTFLSFSVGMTTGMLAATLRGAVDQVLSRTVDIMMAFPALILSLLVISVLGSSVPVLIGVIAFIDATRVFRLSRAVAMDIATLPYVEIAKLRGENLWWIMRREILPNSVAPLAAEFGIRFCFVFLFIAALSFIGLGIQPPSADWGSMVRENSAAISFGILTPLFPAAAIAVLTVGVNLIVDWFLRNAAGVRVRN